MVVGLLTTLAACGERGTAAHTVLPDTTLARMVAELQSDVERVSGLRALREPRIARADRARLQAYLTDQLREQLPRQRAERLVATYARFGLMPDTLDLVALLAGLYEEQVLGFYDPVTDTLYVVDRVPSGQLEMVLAHELVHALQDQHVDLDSLTQALRDHNDRATAAHAAIEGQATLAMLEWQLQRMTGRQADIASMPGLAERLEEMDLASLGGEAGLPGLAGAPRVVRETLIFPYLGGLLYVQALWRARPERPAPFGEHLPRSTRQVLWPDRALGADAEPTELRFAESPPPGWEEVHSDVLGALEMRILLEEHLEDPPLAREVAAGWAGDRYRLLRGPEGEALIWATLWEREAEAERFARAARSAWERRYGSGATVQGGGSAGGTPAEGERRVQVLRFSAAGGRPAVLVLDLPARLEVDERWGPARFEVDGE